MKDKLDYTLWVTSGIRFSQSNRYGKLQSTIYFALLMLSVYLTIASFIAPQVFTESQSEINSFIVAASFLITILVVLLKGARLGDRSRLQHECGRKIRKLLFELKFAKTDDDFAKISDNYNSILDDFENHSKIDFNYFWYENFNNVNENKRRNAPNWFQRKILAPLIFTVFPITTKTFALIAPPIVFGILIS